MIDGFLYVPMVLGALQLLESIEAGGLTLKSSETEVATDSDPENVATGEVANDAAVATGTDTERVYQGNESNADQALSKKPPEYICKVCDRVYKSKTGLRKHSRSHTGQYPYKCHCGKSFSERRKLIEHGCSHTNKGIKTCNICGFQPKTFLGMKWHESSHMHEVHVCDQCSKHFNSKLSLKQHKKGCHEANYTCTCGKMFGFKYVYTAHLKTHSDEKQFQCTLCNYKTSRKGDLKSHQLFKHSDSAPFLCSVCGKGFKRRNLLEKHESRKYPCCNPADTAHVWDDN
ncbi:zinc finger X-chromosomal protein-like [Saccoglossus kowalevskii]|uniref:Zinc finger protein 41-like n=1 Tax=Saccoglossus kowalevskii TaxID=10224 RepID=A0ABM0LXN2_SACKO|nr:PREDICTED: zinc finger protein 41-like [Saccoglossus kowalevskii]